MASLPVGSGSAGSLIIALLYALTARLAVVQCQKCLRFRTVYDGM